MKIKSMEQNSKLAISNNVKKLRKKLNLTKEELSLLLDFDNSYITKLEGGKISPTIKRLDKIADFFQVSTSDILKNSLRNKKGSKQKKFEYNNIETRKIIGSNITKYRVEKKISKKEFSLILGFSISYISKAEMGLLNITIDKIVQIADILGVHVSKLFE